MCGKQSIAGNKWPYANLYHKRLSKNLQVSDPMTENEALLLVSIPACRNNVSNMSKILAFRCLATLKLFRLARIWTLKLGAFIAS